MGFIVNTTGLINKKKMKWKKDNWVIILIVGVLIMVIFINLRDNRNYKREISSLSDSIKWMEVEYQLLEDRASDTLRLIESYEIKAALYQDSLEDARQRYFNQKVSHAQELEKFKLIPTSEHYLDYIRWIDSISFE
jgi:hypothetical protein